MRCGIRENTKCLDGQQDLTATREAGFIKIWEFENRQARVQWGGGGTAIYGLYRYVRL